MKKKIMLLMIIMILSAGVFAYADSKKNSNVFIEVGLMPFNETWDLTTPDGGYNNEKLLYTNFFSDYSYGWFHVGGDITVYCLMDSTRVSFEPFYTDYSIFTYIEFGTIEFGFRHMCMHPQNTQEGRRSPVMTGQKAYEEFYLRLYL